MPKLTLGPQGEPIVIYSAEERGLEARKRKKAEETDDEEERCPMCNQVLEEPDELEEEGDTRG